MKKTIVTESDNFFIDRHAHINTDVDALLGENLTEAIETADALMESITSIADLDVKLQPLTDAEILSFMSKLRGGTYFNMGMFSTIAPNAANKHKRIYKITNMSAIVSGVDYENIGTTKDFRDRTGEGPGTAWYDHKPGFEHRVGTSKRSPDKQYVLWKYDDKKGRSVEVWYFVVDTIAGTVDPVSLDGLLEATYLTDSVKKSLMPKKVTGIDKTTGELITNDTNWRTAAFEHIFWLSQAGANPMDLGHRFLESLETADKTLTESDNFFVDRHAGIKTDVDALLSDGVTEDLKEAADKVTIRCANACYEDDDGYPCNVGIFAGDLSFEELTDILYDAGMLYVDVYDEYEKEEEARFAASYKPGDVVDVFDADEEFVKDFIAANGLDPDEYDHVGFFESKKTKANNLKESYRRIITVDHSLLDNELFVDFD